MNLDSVGVEKRQRTIVEAIGSSDRRLGVVELGKSDRRIRVDDRLLVYPSNAF